MNSEFISTRISTNQIIRRVSKDMRDNTLLPLLKKNLSNITDRDLTNGKCHECFVVDFESKNVFSPEQAQKTHFRSEIKGIIFFAIITEYLSRHYSSFNCLNFTKFETAFPAFVTAAIDHSVDVEQLVLMWKFIFVATKFMNIRPAHNKNALILAANLFVAPNISFTLGSRKVKRTELCVDIFIAVTGVKPIERKRKERQSPPKHQKKASSQVTWATTPLLATMSSQSAGALSSHSDYNANEPFSKETLDICIDELNHFNVNNTN